VSSKQYKLQFGGEKGGKEYESEGQDDCKR
jgi:hypothetical protein